MEINLNGKKYRVGKQGQIRTPGGTRPELPWNKVERILVKAKDFINSKNLPYLSNTLNGQPPAHLKRTNLSINAYKIPGSTAKLFKNAQGELYYVRLNGHAVRANSANAPHKFRLFGTRYQQAKNLLQTNLLNTMMTRIQAGGNINVSNLTNLQKNIAHEKLLEQMLATEEAIKEKKKEPKTAYTENRLGYLNNFRLGLIRGMYALKPLPGSVGRRIPTRSPNRPPPGKGRNIIFNEPLKKPHIVIDKGLVHLNPTTVLGMIKSYTGANIAPKELKYWLRWMRANFPNQILFRYMRKNIKPEHVRFSRAS